MARHTVGYMFTSKTRKLVRYLLDDTARRVVIKQIEASQVPTKTGCLANNIMELAERFNIQHEAKKGGRTF